MKELESQRNDIFREFLPPRCSAQKDLIMEIVGKMPYDTFEIFVLWYMDELSVSEIAIATGSEKSDVVGHIRRGQGELRRALGPQGDEIHPTGTIPIITQAFQTFYDRHFGGDPMKEFIGGLFEGAGNDPQRNRQVGGTISSKGAAGSCPENSSTKGGTSVLRMDAGRRQVGRRRAGPGAVKGKAGPMAAAVAAIFAVHAAVPIKVAAAVAASLILLISGILAYHFTVRQDRQTPLPGDVVIGEQIPPQAPPLKSVRSPGVNPTREAITTGTSMDVPAGQETQETAESKEPPPERPGEEEKVTEPVRALAPDPKAEEYLEALHQGEIRLQGDDCPCGHVNPVSARAIHMKQVWGQVAWAILSGDGQTMLYQGSGIDVTEELVSLYKEGKDGEYYIEFTYTSAYGQTAVRSLPVRIDGGEIYERQYE